MPLHLLGKKSWNVYNQDNVERVRRDEEKARLAQQHEEREQRDNDAARKLRILRGDAEHEQEADIGSHEPRGQKRKYEDQDENHSSVRDRGNKRRDDNSTARNSRQRSPNTTTESLDNISNMRFRDAAGRNAETPWYRAPKADFSNDTTSSVGRDVWGNEDKSRHSRDQKRLDSSDPLLAMKKGVKQLRDVERQRIEWRRERERDLHGVEELARRERRRKRRKERHTMRERSGEENERDRNGERIARYIPPAADKV